MIRVLRDWLSTQPEDDDWDGELRWFNRSREWCGERYRIIVGDVMISVCLWRWGLYISIRGQETPE